MADYPKYIGVRLTADGREALRSLVQLEQTTVSEFVRKLIEREVHRELPQGGSDDAA